MPIRLSWIFSVCIALIYLLACAPVDAAMTLARANVVIEVAGSKTPIQSSIELPYNWDYQNHGLRGIARFSLEFASEHPELTQAILIWRIGNTFEVKLNGTVIGKMGTPGGNVEDYAKQARILPIPIGLMAKLNMLEIAIDAQGGRQAGLSPVIVGAADELRDIYENMYRWRRTGYLVISIVSAVFGTLGLLLWLRQGDVLFMYYGVSELLFVLRINEIYLDHSPLPWPWWGIVNFSAQSIGTFLALKFVIAMMEWRQGIVDRICEWGMWLTVPFATLYLYGGWFALGPFWLLATELIIAMTTVMAVQRALHGGSSEQKVLALVLVVILVCGIRDLYVYRYLHTYYGVVWSAYAWLGLGLSLTWILSERMRKSAQTIAAMNVTLLQRLAVREQELNAMFVLQTQMEREHAIIQERQRITRDMHDGLGSQLVGTLQLAQNPNVPRETLTVQLREMLDHLKLTVDAMQNSERDIGSQLGSLRYRLNPRLAAAGVELDWMVEPLPQIAGWTLQNSRDLQMILFEAFSNMIVHAAATHAALTANLDEREDVIRIVLRDNGKGFDVTAAISGGGHGLSNMQARARSLGAHLHFESAPSGTTIELILGLPQS